jgi:hypothetical protein
MSPGLNPLFGVQVCETNPFLSLRTIVGMLVWRHLSNDDDNECTSFHCF